MDSGAASSRAGAAREFVHRLGRGDAEMVVALMSERVRYKVPGRSSLAGEFHGRSDVADHMRRLCEETAGTLETLKLHDVMVGEEHVAALVTVGATGWGRVAHGRLLYLFGFDEDDAIDALEVFFDDEGAMERFLDHR